MSTVRVVAAVVDTKQLTLYKDDGNTVAIPQGDPRIRKILDDITPVISRGEVANVNVAEHNVYRDFEEQTGGFAKFFRVARSKVAGFFGASQHDNDKRKPIEPTQVGVIPALSTAIDDIIANAQPAAHADFGQVNTDETVVAVVGSGADAKVIPGMENLKGQFVHALKLGSTKGVENFLRRLSAVIDQRQHSIHDLLRFMERGDLPIADDGSIIIYKALRSRSNKELGKHYVDLHSGNVTQKVGSYVCMDPKMVDHNRRNECSNGLHVARRGYLGSFGGDVCVLAKVAPEDVIAVPNYDANKMRVCGYHILFELDADSYSKLKANKPMTDNPKAQALLGRAIAGNHPARLEEVRITKGYGGGLQITPLDSKGKPVRTKGPAPKVKALDDVQTAAPVDPKAVAKEVTAAKAAAPAGNSRQQQARALLDNGDIQELVAFKKRSKVSWASLGISEEDQKHILVMSANPVPKPAPRPATKQAPTVKAPPKKAGRPTTASGGGRKAQMFELDKTYRNTKASFADRANAATELLKLRKGAKKSWASLGYPKLTDQDLLADVDKFRQMEAAAASKTYPDTNAGRARKLFDEKKWGPLADFSKNRKKGFAALGFTPKEVAEIKLHIGD